MGLTPPAGGGGLTGGIAQGQIRIDTHSLALSRAQVIREARLMADGLRGIGDAADRGVKQADSAFARLSRTMNDTWRTTSLVIAAIAGMGVKSAQSVKMLEVRFRMLAGSQEAANEQLAMLRELSEDLGQPFLDVAEGATAIMPALRGTNASLKDTIMLVQRLAILDPVQGVSGAAFAVREFLNGEYLSLVRRLELDRKRLVGIRDEADGDQAKMIEGLSQYIDEIGVTNEQLAEMGKTGAYAFQVLRSEGTETLALFFTPFLNDVLIPLTRAFGDFLRELRKTSPELQKFIGIAAGLGAVSAVAQRGLPLIGSIPGGAALGKAGVYGAALYGGAQLGGYVARKAGLPGTEGKSQSEVMGDVTETLKKVVFLWAAAWGQTIKGLITAGEILDNAWDSIISVLKDAVTRVKELADSIPGVNFPTAAAQAIERRDVTGIEHGWNPWAPFDQGAPSGRNPEIGQQVAPAFDELVESVNQSGDAAAQSTSKWDDAKQSVDDFLITLGEGMGVIEENRTAADVLNETYQRLTGTIRGAIEGAAGRAGANEPTITDDLLTGFQQYKDDLAQIEADAQADALAETEEYEQRKADLIRSYAENVARLLEDEAIRYERALGEAQRREGDIRATLQETLADSSEEVAQATAALTADYHREQERTTRDHLRRLRDIQRDGKENIMRAAAKLDGVGVFEAQRALVRRLEDEKENFKTQEDDRREQLALALQDEKENYAERVQAAKDHAAEQIRQLWERFGREEQERREDNARRLEQLRQDHQAQLTELGTQHQSRLTQIRTQAAAELKERDDAWLKEFNSAQTHNNTMLTLQKGGEAMLETELTTWWEAMRKKFADENARAALQWAQPLINQGIGGIQNLFSRSFDSGGRIRQSGLFQGARDEEVLRPDIARTLRRLMGGEISQGGLVTALAGGGGSVSTSVGDVYVQIPAGVTDPDSIGRIVQDKILQVLKGARRS